MLRHPRDAIPAGQARGIATTYLLSMAKASIVRAVFKGIARMNDSYAIEVGPIRAKGVPAILVAVTGIVVGAGIAQLLVRTADKLPETLTQARGLAETLRRDHPRLNP